jgi:NAD(P)-dependent dehydrogenase (short-subunit alcohol dehydrogenase family)
MIARYRWIIRFKGPIRNDYQKGANIMTKTWFVTGAARGIGAAIVQAALNAGDRVVATVRDPRKIRHAFSAGPDRLLVLALDVTQETQVPATVEAAIKQFGRIDVLVNNAGYGQLGVFEESRPDEVHRQFSTNVFGLMAVTRSVLPGMRKQRSGRIFNLLSVSGLKGVFGASLYCASKFAVEGFSQSIAEELAPFGVYVTVISPGFVRTDFLDPSSVKYSDAGISDYAKAMTDFRSFHDNRNHNQAGDPAKLAAVILHLAQVEKPPVSFVAGSDAVEWTMNAIKTQQAQLDAWRELSVSTDRAWDVKAQAGKVGNTVVMR